MANPIEDQDFLEFQRNGSSAALARVFDALAPRLLLLAGHFTRDSNQAEDLVQTTFLQAIRDVDQYDGNKPIARWLASILKHRALDGKRKASGLKTEAWQVLPGGEIDPAQWLEEQEGFKRIVDAIEGLSAPYREVVSLRIVHGIQPTAIAHTLGRSPGTVRMQLKRGLDRLRQAIPEHSHGFGLFLLDPLRELSSIREDLLTSLQAISPATSDLPVGAVAQNTPSLFSRTAVPFSASLVMKVIIPIGIVLLLALAFLNFGGTHETEESHPHQSNVVQAHPIDQELHPNNEITLSGQEFDTTPERQTVGQIEGVLVPIPTHFPISIKHARTGLPAGNVGIFIRPIDTPSLGLDLRTDVSGLAYARDLEEKPHELYLDRADRTFRFNPQNERGLEILLPSGDDVIGVVTDLDNQPIENAEIYRINGAHTNVLQEITTSSSDGKFKIDSMSTEAKLVARAKGYQPSELGWHREGKECVLVLGAKGHVLRGQVLDPDGKPVPFAWLALGVDEDAREAMEGSSEVPAEQERRKPMDLEGILVRADSEGHFACDEVPAGFTLVLARPLDLSTNLVGIDTFWMQYGGDGEIVVQLEPGGQVHGVVRDEKGRAIAGMPLEIGWEGSNQTGQMEDDIGPWMSHRRATSNADGSFRIVGLLPGEYDLRTQSELHNGNRAECNLLKGEIYRWDPVVRSDSAVNIRLHDADDNPLTGWRIDSGMRQRALNDSNSSAQVTNEKGEWPLLGLEKDRSVTLRIYAPISSSAFESFPTHTLTLKNPEGGAMEIRITHAMRQTGSVSGTLLNPQGDPASQVMLELGDSDSEGSQFVSTAQDGSFQFKDVPLGEYRIRLNGNKPNLARFEIAAGVSHAVGNLVIPR